MMLVLSMLVKNINLTVNDRLVKVLQDITKSVVRNS